MGIDDNDGADITRKWMDTESVACMYQLTDHVIDYQAELVVGPDAIDGASGTELLRSARQGKDPIIAGAGDPESVQQTGNRKWRR
jgi:hypothetical protein